MIAVGQKAPDLTLPNQKGEATTLSKLWKEGPVVLYFYPKDETAGCTAQACGFRDAYTSFKDAGAEVVGVSSDDANSHKGFADHHRLPFVLLADVRGEARKAFGVKKTLGLLPGRTTFVIDRHGTVQHTFDSQLRPTAHVGEALDVVKRLAAG
jgi:peroxiredoxin Q/BCP